VCPKFSVHMTDNGNLFILVDDKGPGACNLSIVDAVFHKDVGHVADIGGRVFKPFLIDFSFCAMEAGWKVTRPKVLADAGAPAASEYLRGEDEEPWGYALRILDLVFHRDVDRVAGITALWEERAPPKPLPQASEMLEEVEEPKECPKDSVLGVLGLNPREVRVALAICR
jgi:hypothetical protein